MPEKAGQASSGATLEKLQNQGSYSRRSRPPNLGDGGDADRVPLRAEADGKLHRRESRLGLRSIFGRHRGGSDADKTPVAAPRDVPQRSGGGIRASLAEISNWPYALHHGQRSEIALPSLSKSQPTASSLRHKKSASVVRGQGVPNNARGSIAIWDPPPLFQAYPQAIKHAHLPACTTSTESVLRLHSHKKNSDSLGAVSSQGILPLDAKEESACEKAKKKHRRNPSGSSLKLDWTTKIYVLVTSGYLLQYSGEGNFDRLPERILHLGKDSAAFASDVIPGRHWVLQVSSVTEPDRAATSPATSLFSRLPFRGHERKHASNFLLVFESAEEMDSWITFLRREIEALGGRKYLSETGKPKIDDSHLYLRNQTSQRTLVMKDPDRFSRVLSPDLTWEPPDIHLAVEPDAFHDQSFDDTSTASVVSHDGRQLDGLRDSTNRLSFISSGQRTVITSAGSSPACSPVRDSFMSDDDMHPLDLQHQDEQPHPQARPNAAAISDRRQSLRTINHLFDIRAASGQSPRPQSTSYSNSWQPEHSLAPTLQTTINFSVPQASSKRYSSARSPPMESTSVWSPPQPRMSLRRPPPTALSINPRPLSLVEDQPSPLSPPSTWTTEDVTTTAISTAPDTPSIFSSWAQEVAKNEEQHKSSVLSDPNSNLASNQDAFYINSNSMPEQYPSLNSIRASVKPGGRRESSIFGLLERDLSETVSAPRTTARDIPRSQSSLGYYGGGHQPDSPATQETLRSRRLSLYSQSTERPAINVDQRFLNPREAPQRPRVSSLKPVPRSSQHLRVDSLRQGVQLQRRSMSQLTEGPPPAPPPSRALPPIPLHRKSSLVSAGHF